MPHTTLTTYNINVFSLPFLHYQVLQKELTFLSFYVLMLHNSCFSVFVLEIPGLTTRVDLHGCRHQSKIIIFLKVIRHCPNMSTCVSSPVIREDRLSRFDLRSRKGPIGLLHLLSLASPLSHSFIWSLDTAGKLREACGLFSVGLRCRLNWCQVATGCQGAKVSGCQGTRVSKWKERSATRDRTLAATRRLCFRFQNE